MQIDLYTLYLYSYSKEYLCGSSKDMTKLNSFSKSSNCIFIDDFIIEEVLASTPMDFFKYLERRQCFNIKLGKNKNDGLILECSCRHSLEHWCRDTKREKDGQLIFVKKEEVLWATKYRELSEEDIFRIRLGLKKNKYMG